MMLKKRQSRPMTREMAAKAKYLVERLGLYQHQAAAVLGVNQGRISEVVTGKRHPGVPAADQMSFDFE